MALCNCDAFGMSGAPHEAGLVVDMAECETTLRPRGPMVSPHLFPYARYANDPWGVGNDPVE